jgi:hypothetical protein
MTSLKFFNYVPKLLLTLVFSFLTGLCLSAEPADVTDRELSIVTAYSELELELDARITYEMTPGVGANLATILQIEQELIASSISERKLYLLSRVNELKQHLLAIGDDGKVVHTKNSNQSKRLSVSGSKKGVVSRGMAKTDPPVLNSIEIDKVSIDVSADPETVTFTLDVSDETGVDWDRSCLCITSPGGALIILRSTDSNGVFTLDLSSSDPAGEYYINSVQLYDTIGNEKIYGRSEIQSLGFPSSIELSGGTESDGPVLNSIEIDR